MDLRFWKGAMSATLWSAAALLGLAAMLAWFLRRQRRRRLASHLLRLACDIVTVADSIDEDLSDHAGVRTFEVFRTRCREYRERAEAFVAHGARLDAIPVVRVKRALELLHDEHRRVVDLRSEVDAALAGSRGTRVPGTGRAVVYAAPAKGARSSWPSSGFCTRPSTLA